MPIMDTVRRGIEGSSAPGFRTNPSQVQGRQHGRDKTARMPRTLRLRVGFLVVLALACQEEGGSPERSRLASHYTSRATADCGRLFGCCTAEERDVFLRVHPGVTDQASCVAFYKEGYAEAFSAQADALEADKGRYEASAAAACVDDTQSCRLARTCDGVVVGLLAQGHGCGTDAECATRRCSYRHLCINPGASGAPCDLDLDCVPSTYCDLLAPEKLCQPTQVESDRCLRDRECASGLCSGERCVAYTSVQACDGL
jgi:hypothetical protein